ncbi:MULTISPECIES: ABC transporter permease [Brevibacterium]|uniref:ABC transporter permease n=1 Tax=Brevibacterium aurantiacum TaxID=273384 RepID=A0A2H1J8K5_BREAU|nr:MULTISPECIES: ABC transporter permease [Brevibacterium]SMX83691.1 hypothetical protein BAUR920_01858 [Brevibacterium aurantiacum]
MRLVVNEFAKMRHLRVGALVLVLLTGVVGLTAFRGLASGMTAQLGDPAGFPWKILLAGLGFSAGLISPLVIAAIASRQVEAEHAGNGWLLSATSGVTPGRMCRSKFLALGALVTAATVLQSLILIAIGFGLGITSPLPLEHWLGYTAAVIVVNLAVLAAHLLLSSTIENQLVCMGIAVIGLFIAVFGSALPDWLAMLTPWGYYALTAPADYIGTDLVYLDIPYLRVMLLGLVGVCLFSLITARFDRREE